MTVNTHMFLFGLIDILNAKGNMTIIKNYLFILYILNILTSI